MPNGNYRPTKKRLEHSLQAALGSGRRIVNAADDAAGLAIAENIRGQVTGIKKLEIMLLTLNH